MRQHALWTLEVDIKRTQTRNKTVRKYQMIKFSLFFSVCHMAVGWMASFPFPRTCRTLGWRFWNFSSVKHFTELNAPQWEQRSYCLISLSPKQGTSIWSTHNNHGQSSIDFASLCFSSSGKRSARLWTSFISNRTQF